MAPTDTILARDVKPGDFCDIYTVEEVSVTGVYVWIKARDNADGHSVWWKWYADDETPVRHPVVSALIVVDTTDGYVFSKDGEGEFFTVETAEAFARQRNYPLDAPTYKVFRLSEV